jgi:hypothetical protein
MTLSNVLIVLMVLSPFLGIDGFVDWERGFDLLLQVLFACGTD